MYTFVFWIKEADIFECSCSSFVLMIQSPNYERHYFVKMDGFYKISPPNLDTMKDTKGTSQPECIVIFHCFCMIL